MITKDDNYFILNTKNTTYAMRVLPTGHLEHLYYGRKIKINKDTIEAIVEKRAFADGNTNYYDNEHKNISLENIKLELSSYGKGDIRESSIDIVFADGSFTTDFIFHDYKINQQKTEIDDLPTAYDEDNIGMELKITLKEKYHDVYLYLYYYVFKDCDAITRRISLENKTTSEIKIKKIMSLQLDFDDSQYLLSTFNGAWAREMNRNDFKLTSGKHVNSSFCGVSSSRSNPFIMIRREHTSEDFGEAYGFNLIYSGNHYEAFEINSFNKARLVTGINPELFEYLLEPNETFNTPEAVMTYSNCGLNGMSYNMHEFVRNHIVRGEWKNKVRPILLNSWEASYFHISESSLLKLASEAKKCGIELFVLDDGWFGKRSDDTKSLGDWDVNKKKLPHGIKGLAEKINKLGLDFGLWVEPEMINVDSELYQIHPDWSIDIPNRDHSEGRNQRILDYTNDEVTDYIIEKMTEVFSSGNITYVKWDMNRIFSDYYSKTLSNKKQLSVAHRYCRGLYKVMKELTKRFPHILFEGCASGGNRFDLGILCYFHQIWASDDTDALCRAQMQHNYSYGYPLSVVGAHVSNIPNHQTLRKTPIETRFNVAAFGIFGYELNLVDVKEEDKKAIKAQIEIYKKYRKTLQFGRFYRGRSFQVFGSNETVLNQSDGNLLEWTVVAKDKKEAIGMIMQKLNIPNTSSHIYYPKGLDDDILYQVKNREMKYNVKEFGDLINMLSPIHIKQDSFLHNAIAKFVKLDGETEDYLAYGDTLMYAGLHLHQAFAGTGYNDQVRYFPDFGSRIYFIEKKEEE